MSLSTIIDTNDEKAKGKLKDTEWARVSEDDRAIKIETDKLEAVEVIFLTSTRFLRRLFRNLSFKPIKELRHFF